MTIGTRHLCLLPELYLKECILTKYNYGKQCDVEKETLFYTFYNGTVIGIAKEDVSKYIIDYNSGNIIASFEKLGVRVLDVTGNVRTFEDAVIDLAVLWKKINKDLK